MQACTFMGINESFIFQAIRKRISHVYSPTSWETGPCFLMLIFYSCGKRKVSLRIEILEGMKLILRVLKSSRWIGCIIINQNDPSFLKHLIFEACFFPVTF